MEVYKKVRAYIEGGGRAIRGRKIPGYPVDHQPVPADKTGRGGSRLLTLKATPDIY